MSTNKELNAVIGEKIKELRKKKKMTREQLAEKTDVSTRFLADVESGKVGISVLTLKKICTVLNTTSDYILGISSYTDEEQQYAEIDKKIKNLDEKYLPAINRILDTFCDIIKMDHNR